MVCTTSRSFQAFALITLCTLLQLLSGAPALAREGWENGIPLSLEAGIPVIYSGNIKKKKKVAN